MAVWLDKDRDEDTDMDKDLARFVATHVSATDGFRASEQSPRRDAVSLASDTRGVQG